MKKDTENLLLWGGGAFAVWYFFFRTPTSATTTTMLPKTTASMQPSSGSGLLSQLTTSLSNLLSPAVNTSPVPASTPVQLPQPMSITTVTPLPTDQYFNYDPATGNAVADNSMDLNPAYTMSGVNDKYREEFELM
jgi:hypothetical protein